MSLGAGQQGSIIWIGGNNGTGVRSKCFLMPFKKKRINYLLNVFSFLA